jgi:hypothetical protein
MGDMLTKVVGNCFGRNALVFNRVMQQRCNYDVFFRSEFSRRERNFLLQRLMAKIGCGDALNIGRDGIAPRTTSNIPAKRRFFRAGTVPVVWKDGMVETIWTKLHAPHADIEPVSDTRARNGIFCCRDRVPNWPLSP